MLQLVGASLILITLMYLGTPYFLGFLQESFESSWRVLPQQRQSSSPRRIPYMQIECLIVDLSMPHTVVNQPDSRGYWGHLRAQLRSL